MKLLSASDVCECLSSKKKKFSYTTLNNWIRRGVITPLRDAEGTGHHRVFSLMDVLAIAAGHGLKSNGYSPSVAREVTAIIQSMTEDELLKNFSTGKTCLMIVGKAKKTAQVAPVLMKRAAIVDNPENIDYAAAAQYGLSPTALDVKQLYDNIVTQIEKLAAKRKSRA